jgi:hypothetical protein
MDKQPKRIPTRLSIDLTILAASAILIVVGVWIGVQGPSPVYLLSMLSP